MKIYLALAAIALSIPASAAPKKASSPPPEPTPEEVAIRTRELMIGWAQEVISERLKDPESARFRDVFTSPKLLAVCGQVNAKNGMGGYAGFRRFIAAKDKAGTEGDGTYFVEANWDSRCKLDEAD